MFEATSTQQNPGQTIFPTAGVYRVIFTVTDSEGQADPNPPVTTVIVKQKPPKGTITSPVPSEEVSIYEGDAVIFKGEGVSPAGLVLTYGWSVETI